MQTDRCEECLGPPSRDGRCSAHPYARLIRIDDHEADEERALLRDIRRSRAIALVGGVSVLGAVVAFFGALGSSALSFPVVVLAMLVFAVFLPPAVMYCSGRQGITGRPYPWPAWLLAGAGMGWWMGWYGVAVWWRVGFDTWSWLVIGMLFFSPIAAWAVGAIVWLIGQEPQDKWTDTLTMKQVEALVDNARRVKNDRRTREKR